MERASSPAILPKLPFRNLRRRVTHEEVEVTVFPGAGGPDDLWRGLGGRYRLDLLSIAEKERERRLEDSGFGQVPRGPMILPKLTKGL